MKLKIPVFVCVFLLLIIPKTIFASSIVLNEFMANPNDDTEWIELYNPTDQTIDLSGWKIKDGNTLTSDDLTLTGQITPLSFITFDHDKGWLNDSDDETITLLDNNSQTIDTYQYNGTTKGKTYGRQPDGGSWTLALDPSKNLSNNSSSPTPSPSPALTPSPTPAPSSFTMTNAPSQINSDQSFSINISLSLPDNPNTNFYLKGAFKITDGSNYFGYTKVSNSWVKNSSSYSDQYTITTDSFGNWSGNLEAKPDKEDSGFTGTGSYIFKIGRYTSSGSGPSWSNESTITITGQAAASPTSLPSPSASSVSSNTPFASFATPIPTKTPKPVLKIATVAGIASESSSFPPEVSVKHQKQSNSFFLIGSIFVIIGLAIFGFIFYRRKFK